MRFSAGFTDRRRALREMMRDRILHEHATDERTARTDQQDQNRYDLAELNSQKYEEKSLSMSQMVPLIDYWIVSTTTATETNLFHLFQPSHIHLSLN